MRREQDSATVRFLRGLIMGMLFGFIAYLLLTAINGCGRDEALEGTLNSPNDYLQDRYDAAEGYVGDKKDAAVGTYQDCIKGGCDLTESSEDGEAGADGSDGSDGSDGPAGPQGDEGERGEDGANGSDGADGEDGTDGESCELERRNERCYHSRWKKFDLYIVCGEDEEFLGTKYKRERCSREDDDDDD